MNIVRDSFNGPLNISDRQRVRVVVLQVWALSNAWPISGCCHQDHSTQDPVSATRTLWGSTTIMGKLMGAEVLLAGLILLPFIIWILPILLIATSDRASGRERLAWILLVIFISWFSWIFYLIFAPVRKDEDDFPVNPRR